MAGRIIVRFDERGDTYAPGGAILIPDTHKADKNEAVVLAVGPGKYDANGNYVPPPVAVGDRVLAEAVWGKTYAFFDDSEKLQRVVILNASDIIAKVVG